MENEERWLYKEPRTKEQIAEARRLHVLETPAYVGGKPIVFTCDDCTTAPRCKLAFDFYNTDGDCLLEK